MFSARHPEITKQLTAANGSSIERYQPKLQFFVMSKMENAKHAYELPPVHHTVIRVAKAQMGVAGDNSWGARTHEEFLLPVNEKLEFEFSFRGI